MTTFNVCISIRSAELDDILEEESDDENSTPPAISSPSSNSPDGSFRLPNRRNPTKNSADSTSSASSTDGRVGTPPSRNKVSSKNNHSKSHDSGFSDSSDNNHNREERATSSQSLKNSISEAGSDDSNHCIEIVHETNRRTGSHVSKVYFYSVSDVLQEDQSEQEHVSILDCETGRVRRGLSMASEPILLPPLSPPLSHRINVSTDSEELPKLDPLACDINYYEGLMENKPLPKTGTSSLGRKKKWRSDSPTSLTSCNTCKSPVSQFPKTNGSLYESLSLGRRCHCKKVDIAPTSPSVSLPSPTAWNASYDSFDDPLSGSRRSFRSDLSTSSSSAGPTSPWGTSQEKQETSYSR